MKQFFLFVLASFIQVLILLTPDSLPAQLSEQWRRSKKTETNYHHIAGINTVGPVVCWQKAFSDNSLHVMQVDTFGVPVGGFVFTPSLSGVKYLPAYSLSLSGDYLYVSGNDIASKQFYAAKISLTGSTIWEATYPSITWSTPYEMEVRSDGYLYITASIYIYIPGPMTPCHYNADAIKLDTLGNLVARATAPWVTMDDMFPLKSYPDGGLAFCSQSNYIPGSTSGCGPFFNLDKLDSNLSLLWRADSFWVGGLSFEPYAVDDSGYTFLGGWKQGTPHTGSPIWVTRLDPAGNITWNWSAPAPFDQGDVAFITTDTSGNAYVLAQPDSAIDGTHHIIGLFKITPAGATAWSYIDSSLADSALASSIYQSSVGLALTTQNRLVVYTFVDSTISLSGSDLVHRILEFDTSGTLMGATHYKWDYLDGRFSTPSAYIKPGKTGEVYFTASQDSSFSVSHQHLARYRKGTFTPNVTGWVYDDASGDCIKDAGETGLGGIVYEMAPSGYYSISHPDGNLDQFLPDGSYTFTQLPPVWIDEICPGAPASFTLSSGSPTAHIEFADSFLPGYELEIAVVNYRARPGMTHSTRLPWKHVHGDTVYNAMIQFTYDTIFHPYSIVPAPDSVAANQMFWKFPVLAPGDNGYIQIYDSVDASVGFGYPYTNTAEFYPISADVFVASNFVTVSDTTTSSYDPNYKSVQPPGFGPSHYISPYDSLHTYTVFFQNTGTDTAFTVVIRDTLDTQYQIGSVMLMGASHPYTFSVYGPRVMQWQFDNILLPDSATDELGSQGWLSFRVLMNPGLPEETVLNNKVSITFDYNIPIVTNTTFLTIDKLENTDAGPQQGSFTVFPNPAQESVTLRRMTGIADQAAVDVFDITGKWLGSDQMNAGSSELRVDLSGYPAGLLFMRISTATEVMTVKVLKM